MKVGDYVRTKNGLIFKIIGGNVDDWDFDISFGMLETFEENWLELYRDNDNGSFFNNKNIVKSSPNIIDLIEVGDYVNGYRVVSVYNYGIYIEIPFIDQESIGCNEDLIRIEEIKSIVTKEQFESMEYKVVE
jgi:hypothetical protein